MDTEVKAPLAILGTCLLLLVVAGFVGAGAAGAGATIVGLGVVLAFNIVLGIVGLYVAAALLQIEFGHVGTAVIKLAAVFSASVAVGAFLPDPILGWLVALVIYLGLLAWLFALEPFELVVCVVILAVVRFVGGMILGMILSGS